MKALGHGNFCTSIPVAPLGARNWYIFNFTVKTFTVKTKRAEKPILKIEEDMKKSRLFSLMMVAVLVFSLCSNAFAADETVR